MVDDERLTVWIRGRVQGVGMRWWIRSVALELGLRGWARNCEDGRVEIVAEGPRSALESLLATVQGGGDPGRIDSVVHRWSAAAALADGFVER